MKVKKMDDEERSAKSDLELIEYCINQTKVTIETYKQGEGILTNTGLCGGDQLSRKHFECYGISKEMRSQAKRLWNELQHINAKHKDVENLLNELFDLENKAYQMIKVKADEEDKEKTKALQEIKSTWPRLKECQKEFHLLCERAREFYGMLDLNGPPDPDLDCDAQMWNNKYEVFNEARNLVSKDREIIRSQYTKELVDMIFQNDLYDPDLLFIIDQAILSTENGKHKDGKIVCPGNYVGITGGDIMIGLLMLLWEQFPGKSFEITPQNPVIGYILEFKMEDGE